MLCDYTDLLSLFFFFQNEETTFHLLNERLVNLGHKQTRAYLYKEGEHFGMYSLNQDSGISTHAAALYQTQTLNVNEFLA